jgi:hypothetical protein
VAAVADAAVCPILTLDAAMWREHAADLDEPLHVIEIADPGEAPGGTGPGALSTCQGPGKCRTLTGQGPFPVVRALYRAVPARSPLLPGAMHMGRAACVFPTSPPQQAKRVRSGTLRLCSVRKKAAGKGWYRHWGETRNPPAPRTPGSRFPPRPPFLPPRHAGPRRANDRGRVQAPASREPRLAA